VAEGIMRHYPEKKKWRNDPAQSPEELAIISERLAETVGTHVVTYASPVDALELKHEAFSREGFAHGAVLAAEWLPGKQGVFGMKDLLGL